MKHIVTIRLDETSDDSDGSQPPNGPMIENRSYEMDADQYTLISKIANMCAEDIEIVADFIKANEQSA